MEFVLAILEDQLDKVRQRLSEEIKCLENSPKWDIDLYEEFGESNVIALRNEVIRNSEETITQIEKAITQLTT
jgi:hypothetical protein